jgi:predicted GIY-YIG superfamily endonuclease
MDFDIPCKPIVYAIALGENKYYIGISHSLNLRLGQHSSLAEDSGSAKWVKKYGFKKVVEIIYPGNIEIENDLTRKYMLRYGWENVRGGYMNKISMNKPKFILDHKVNNSEEYKQLQKKMIELITDSMHCGEFDGKNELKQLIIDILPKESYMNTESS